MRARSPRPIGWSGSTRKYGGEHGVLNSFPNPDAYLRLVTTFLMEYAEDGSVSRAYLSEESIHTLLPQVA
jgi:hypothetical protein